MKYCILKVVFIKNTYIKNNKKVKKIENNKKKNKNYFFYFHNFNIDFLINIKKLILIYYTTKY